jgi:DNA invertase Pin-like site-specific DNA recombinase
VSTSEQNIEHQRIQAEEAGFKFDKVICDDGVSGIATKLQDRPNGQRLFDMLREGDTLVVRWVDRLGRNYQDVTNTIRHFMGEGVVIETIINRMRFDGSTKDPMQCAVRDALISFMAATAQAQAEVQKEAQTAGIAAAKSDPTKYRGRKPGYNRKQFNAVTGDLKFMSVAQVAKSYDLTRQTVLRIRDEPQKAEAALARWEM